MTAVAVIAAIVVGVAFLVAGASKLAARESWSVQALDLGAPAVVIPLLPWVEIAVGAALVVQLARPVAAAAALALLLAFTALILLRLSQGRRPACACFGAWSATPIGPRHVLRNAILIVAAALALAG